jgi:hypothetical protein
MRRAAVLIGVLILWGSANGEGFAQFKADAQKTGPSPTETSAPSEEIRMGGIIIAIDLARHKILLQQYRVHAEKIISLNFDKGAAGKMSAFGKGDAVNVWVKGDTLTKIEKIPDPAWAETRERGKEGGILPPPVVQLPAPGAQYRGQTFECRWLKVEGAARYHLQVAEDPAFVLLEDDRKDIWGESYIFYNFKFKRYYFRIRSIDEKDREGKWCETIQFSMLPLSP